MGRGWFSFLSSRSQHRPRDPSPRKSHCHQVRWMEGHDTAYISGFKASFLRTLPFIVPAGDQWAPQEQAEHGLRSVCWELWLSFTFLSSVPFVVSLGIGQPGLARRLGAGSARRRASRACPCRRPASHLGPTAATACCRPETVPRCTVAQRCVAGSLPPPPMDGMRARAACVLAAKRPRSRVPPSGRVASGRRVN